MTNHLELSLPFQVVANANTTALQTFSAELYYRFFSREKEGGVQPLLRVSYHHAIQARMPSSAEVDLVVAFGKPNELHVVLNAGATFSFPWPETQPPLAQFIRPTVGGGLSFPLSSSGEFRLSTEVLAEFQDSSSSSFPRYLVGGALSWTRGRIWVTAGTMVGLTGLSAATPPFIPRLLWAVAL